MPLKEAQNRKKLKQETNPAFQILSDNVDKEWKNMKQLEIENTYNKITKDLYFNGFISIGIKALF